MDADGDGIYNSQVAYAILYNALGQAFEVRPDGSGAGDIIRHDFRGPGQVGLLAIDQQSAATGNMETVWTFGDGTGTVTTGLWLNPTTSAREIYHRQYDSRGEVKQVLTVAAEAAANPLLKSLPPIWKGLEQADSGDLYLAGTTAIDPVNGRYLSQAARGDSNPYRYNGNTFTGTKPPGETELEIDHIAGYFHYLSHPWEMDTDLQVAFWTANIVGVAAGGAAGILGYLGVGTTALSTGGAIGAVGTSLNAVSFTYNATRYGFTGQGDEDLVWDGASLVVDGLTGFGAARGLAKAGLFAADIGINLRQGYVSGRAAQRDFANRDYVSGSLNAISAAFGFAGAGFRSLELGHLLRTDPTANLLNYRLNHKALQTQFFSIGGNLPIKYNAPSTPKVIKNGHLAGKTHPVTGVPFDKDGFPIFQSNGNATLPKDLIGPHISDTKQFQAATRQLWDQIKDNPARQRLFTAEQLEQIKLGEAYIDGFTWHHHQDGSMMQLVDRLIHSKTGHSGGRQVTGGRP